MVGVVTDEMRALLLDSPFIATPLFFILLLLLLLLLLVVIGSLVSVGLALLLKFGFIL